MAGDKAAVAEVQEQEIVLKAKEESYSSKPSSTFSTPRPSSVATPKGFGTRLTPAPRKYVSPMAKAREEKKRREAEGKEWQGLSDMESSSNPSTGSVASDASSAATRNAGPDVPKFGEWEKHSVNSGPCYTLVFQNAAQEKKAGGPIRVHAHRSDSPPRTQDLYQPPPANTTKGLNKKKKKKKTPFPFLCCFTSSSSSSS
jgi:hypothetical protein